MEREARVAMEVLTQREHLLTQAVLLRVRLGGAKGAECPLTAHALMRTPKIQ